MQHHLLLSALSIAICDQMLRQIKFILFKCIESLERNCFRKEPFRFRFAKTLQIVHYYFLSLFFYGETIFLALKHCRTDTIRRQGVWFGINSSVFFYFAYKSFDFIAITKSLFMKKGATISVHDSGNNHILTVQCHAIHLPRRDFSWQAAGMVTRILTLISLKMCCEIKVFANPAKFIELDNYTCFEVNRTIKPFTLR